MMERLIPLFSAIGAPHWLALGLVLLLAELLTGSTFLLWPALAAWVTGAILLFAPLDIPAQLLIFGAVTLASALTGRHYVKGLWAQGGDDKLNDRAAQLRGARGVAMCAFENGRGRVKLGDSEWAAESADELSAGDAVTVVSVAGATLQVSRLAVPALNVASR